MRKITKEACDAFERGRNFKKSNTQVRNNVMYLWGNAIAKKENGKLYITHAGWATRTTKERLNGISGVRVVQRAGTFYCNGIPFDDWHHVV